MTNNTPHIMTKPAEDITAGDMIIQPGGQPFRVDLVTALGPHYALAWSDNRTITLKYGTTVEYIR